MVDFGEAYDENVWRVYGFLAYRVGSRSDAEDLTQTTFERALKAWDRFDERRASPATWLLAIAQNVLIDHYRRDRSSLEDPLDGIEHPEARGTAGPEHELEIAPELASALQLLGPRERELVALRYGGDLTGPELAELSGLTLANVQQILSRALRKLRVALEPALAGDRPSQDDDLGQGASGPRSAKPAAASASRKAPPPA